MVWHPLPILIVYLLNVFRLGCFDTHFSHSHLPPLFCIFWVFSGLNVFDAHPSTPLCCLCFFVFLLIVSDRRNLLWAAISHSLLSIFPSFSFSKRILCEVKVNKMIFWHFTQIWNIFVNWINLSLLTAISSFESLYLIFWNHTWKVWRILRGVRILKSLKGFRKGHESGKYLSIISKSPENPATTAPTFTWASQEKF